MGYSKPAKIPRQQIEVDVPTRSSDEADTYEAETIKVFVDDCGALRIYVGNQRTIVCYAPGKWDGFEVRDVE